MKEHAAIENNKEDVKSIGGSIPSPLYWEFKKIQAERKETATQALENAIRLYVELDAIVEEDIHE